jgi:hypothetical protein
MEERPIDVDEEALDRTALGRKESPGQISDLKRYLRNTVFPFPTRESRLTAASQES